MRNINECIGIIKGINFDRVLNNEEVVYLKSWVNKNRNFVYEQCQAEFIKVVDTILEDNNINEQERSLELQKAEVLLKYMDNNSEKGYELNGIIEGILCDGEINEAEIFGLKAWMDKHSNYIIGHNVSLGLCRVIDDLLKDNIVDDEEKTRLLDILSERLNISKLETKLDNLCNLVKARKNIGMDLINILDNEKTIQEIHNRAETQLMMALSSRNVFQVNQDIIVVSLALIALLNYDGNYYKNVRETYTEVYVRYSEQKIEGMIRTILGRYKIQKTSSSRRRIINVALENAIVPQAFLSGFFDFIYDIYKLNFEYDLPEEPYEDFRFVFDGLRNSMQSEGDDISINVTQKTYKLIEATKQLIKRGDGLDAIIKLSVIIVNIIDKRYWDKEVKISNPYLKKGYEDWEKTLNETTKNQCDRNKNGSGLRSRWEPKFVLSNNSVILNPPIHRVKSQYDYRDIAIVVFNDAEEIYRNSQSDIREIIGGYLINTERIIIEKPLGKLTYRLVVGDEIIYDSKDKLYRDFIIFDKEGQELNNNIDFEGTVCICFKDGDINVESIITKENYRIGFRLVRAGDSIEIGNSVFNFFVMDKPGIFGKLYPNCFVKRVGEDVTIPVYEEVSFVVFEVVNSSNKFEIVINGIPRKLKEMQYEQSNKYNISKYIVELELQKSGIYSVEVNQIEDGYKNRILKEDFAYDTDLCYSKEIVDEYKYIVKVTSSMLDKSIDTELAAYEFESDFIKFENNGSYYNYIIPFDFGFYKIADSDWSSSAEDLWIEDVKDSAILSLYDSECNGLLVYTESGVLVEEDIVLVDKKYYKQVPIYFLNSYKHENNYLLLAFTANGKVKYTIFCYNKCVIDEEKTEVLCLDNLKQVHIRPYFHGKNKVFYDLYNEQKEKIYTSKLLSSGDIDVLNNFDSFTNYTFRFHEKSNKLKIIKNTPIYEVSYTFYSKQDFVGREFKIDEIYFNQLVAGKFTEKQWFLNKAYVRITKIINLEVGLFEGIVFINGKHGKWELKNINPVDVEICSGVIDGTMDIFMTNQGDGLLFNYEVKGILNSLEHPNSPDIFLYTINLKGA